MKTVGKGFPFLCGFDGSIMYAIEASTPAQGARGVLVTLECLLKSCVELCPDWPDACREQTFLLLLSLYDIHCVVLPGQGFPHLSRRTRRPSSLCAIGGGRSSTGSHSGVTRPPEVLASSTCGP